MAAVVEVRRRGARNHIRGEGASKQWKMGVVSASAAGGPRGAGRTAQVSGALAKRCGHVRRLAAAGGCVPGIIRDASLQAPPGAVASLGVARGGGRFALRDLPAGR